MERTATTNELLYLLAVERGLDKLYEQRTITPRNINLDPPLEDDEQPTEPFKIDEEFLREVDEDDILYGGPLEGSWRSPDNS